MNENSYLTATLSLVALLAGTSDCALFQSRGKAPAKPILVYYGLDMTVGLYGSDRLVHQEVVSDYGPKWNRGLTETVQETLGEAFSVMTNLQPTGEQNGFLRISQFSLSWDHDYPPSKSRVRSLVPELVSRYTGVSKPGVGCVAVVHYLGGDDDWHGDLHARVELVVFDHLTGVILGRAAYDGEAEGSNTGEIGLEALVEATEKASENIVTRARSIYRSLVTATVSASKR